MKRAIIEVTINYDLFFVHRMFFQISPSQDLANVLAMVQAVLQSSSTNQPIDMTGINILMAGLPIIVLPDEVSRNEDHI